MKRFFFLILLVSNLSFSQEEDSFAFIDLTGMYIRSHASDRLCTSITEIKVIYDNGENETIFYSNDNSKAHLFLPNITQIRLKRRIVGMELYREIVDATNQIFGTCCVDCSVSEAKAKIPYLYHSSNYCRAISVSTGWIRSNDGQAGGGFVFTYKIRPNHTLVPEIFSRNIKNTYLPIGAKAKLFAKKGFPSELYHYQVATQVDSVRLRFPIGKHKYRKVYNWKNLPDRLKENGGEVLSVSAEDVFGSEDEAHKNIGKTVYFRAVSFDKDNLTQVCSSSNVVDLQVTIAAPKVTKLDIGQPHCPQDAGKVAITFSRNIHEGENTRLSVVRGTLSGGVFTQTGAAYSFDNEQFKNALLAGNKTITLPNVTPLKATEAYQLQFFGNYQYANGQQINTYTDGEEFRKVFQVVEIPPIESESVKPTHNVCHGAHQGAIEISVSGGTPPYRYVLNGQTPVAVAQSRFVISNLPAGTHTVGILDSRGCEMQQVITQEITQPAQPVTIENEGEPAEKDEQPNPSFFKKDVSGFGLKNGQIQAVIFGGTAFAPPATAYQVVLTAQSGATITSFATRTNAQGQFVVHYTNLDKGDYTLTITDKNGCKRTQPVFIDEPDPLVVTLSESVPISCNPTNDDPNNDPKLNADGVIYAQVEGGVKAYRYQWYRIKDGNAEQLLGETASKLEKCTEGTYRVDITDKNNNQTSGTLSLQFPERLTLSVQADEIRCSAPDSGSAQAIVGGGTPPYTYQWSDGQTTATASGLSVGKYFVVVRDKRGCSVQSQVVLSYPQAPQIDSEQLTPLVCHGDQNASIVLTTSGGKGKVAHTWYDASGRVLTQGVSKDGKSVKNLAAGSYKIVLRDQGDCPPVEKTFEIVQPEKLSLQLPQSVTLCQGDSHLFDLNGQIPNATYRWTDASGNLLGTEASFEVHSAGDYFVEAISPEGCKAAAQTRVKQSSEVLEVDFLVATTSYYDYTLKLINLSKKTDALQWQFPDDAMVINQNKQEAEIRFPKEGVYRVGLKGTLGECQKVIEKLLFVEKDRVGLQQNTQVQKHIESFLIVPNPNSGSYQLHIKLSKASPVKVRLIDLLGRELFAPETFEAQTDFILPFNKPNLSAGQYIILVEADGDVLSQKMIVK